MKNNVIVVVITMVIMDKPVGRAVVYFHISNPYLASNLDLGVEKVGTCIRIMQTGIYNFYGLSGCGV